VLAKITKGRAILLTSASNVKAKLMTFHQDVKVLIFDMLLLHGGPMLEGLPTLMLTG
jgi:hypothetical protein